MLIVSAGENLLQLLFVLCMFILVLVLTYYVSRWIAGYQKTQLLNKNLEIIEAIKLGGNKYLAIIRAGKDRTFLIGLGKDEVHLIGELSAEELLEFTPASEGGTPFRTGADFKSMLESMKERVVTGMQSRHQDEKED